ncbi:helix-turn-helix domain-containing protein [Rothia sp. L_38]
MYLIDNGMSENQVATMLGVSRSTITRLKAKNRNS